MKIKDKTKTFGFDVLEYLNNKKYRRTVINVCGGIGCQSLKSKEIIEKLKSLVKKKKLNIEIKETGCLGFCAQGPVMNILPQKVFYTKVKPEDCEEIINSIEKDTVVEKLLYEEEGVKKIRKEDINFYKKQTKIILARVGEINPESIEEYIETKGFEALKQALKMKPEEIIQKIKDSDLRGRGGAGFPTGIKWEFLKNEKSETKYIVCNADEGDPGAFMDRSVLEGDPFSVIEGMIIAAYTTGATHGFIYVRSEYPYAIERLQNALKLAREYNFLGKNILDSNFSFDIEIKKGAGAFVCGEETALIHSIEGERGMPRPRPPFPAYKGIWDKPTNINNVKTYACVPIILRNGPEWFKSLGITLGGTAVLALTGKIKNEGLIEVPMGTKLKEIIFDIGGGIKNNKKFKAVQTGGPSGGCLDESCLELPLDYQSLTKAGSIMGSGGLVVLDETDSMVEVAKFFLTFTQAESCGKCTPCREGTKRLLEIITKISENKAEKKDLELLEDLAKKIKISALCGLGQTAPNPVLSSLRYFRKEFEEKIKNKKKTAHLVYAITDLCKGCDKCTSVCPTHAINGKVGEYHVINEDICIGCGTCARECPFDAIFKKNEIPKERTINKTVEKIRK